MKSRFLGALVIAMLFISLHCYAQDFIMSPGSIGVCSGNWYDPGYTGNYAKNLNVTQTLYSSTGQCLQISFTMFNVDPAGDTLYAYNGSNPTFPLIGKYTGTTLPANIISSTGALTFNFKTNSSATKPGWKATISCVACSTLPALPAGMVSGNYSACNGTFQNPGSANNYPLNSNWTTTIYPSTPGNNLTVNFSSFSLGTGDNLKIYNGPSVSYPLFGTYTGTNSPGSIPATNGPLTFVFTSGSKNGAGWNATVACTPINSGCGNCNGNPPANDYCSNATNLGALPAPAACPSGLGALTVISGTNLCATSEAAFSNHGACSGGAMGSTVADVWYQFTITAPILNVSVTGLDTPEVALYSGSSYISLTQVGCAVGANGQLSNSFPGLSAGTYYLQVSGGSLADQCNFSLVLQNNDNCTECVVNSTLKATPPPVNGAYSPGQTVNFCYTVTNYVSQSGNSLHGVVPSFGAGWDISTFSSVSVPASCSGSGVWSWYKNPITSSANHITVGPGWFYETNIGNPKNVVDNNPGDNSGDNDNGGCQWQYCWSIKVKDSAVCVNGKSLSFTIKTYADGETGSWTSAACNNDPDYTFKAIISCCDSPTIVTTNTSCPASNDGSATASGNGIPPYTFTWKNSSGATILTQTGIDSVSTITNLAPGPYSLLATDNGGCEKLASFTISSNPLPVVNVSSSSTSICNGQPAILTASGAAAYSWQVSSGVSLPDSQSVTVSPLVTTTYTVIGTNAGVCSASAVEVIIVNSLPTLTQTITQPTCGLNNGAINVSVNSGAGSYAYSWNNGSTANNISNLSPGNYSLTVTDSNNCNANIVAQLTGHPAPLISEIQTNETCGNSNGSINISLAGGTSPFSFNWNNGSTTQNLNNISAGNYTLTVTDSNSCTVTGSFNIVNHSGPVISETQTNETCGNSNGSINISLTGGTSPFSFNWNNGASTQNLNNISAGNYTLTVTDSNSCSTTGSYVIVNHYGPLISETQTNETCGNSNGSINISLAGGTSPFSFNWNNGATTQNLNNISAGNYTLTVIDSNGCRATLSTQINSSPSPVITLAATNVTCTTPGGGVSLNITGGTAPYNYRWNNGDSSQNLSNIPAGFYSVVVTDSNNCTATGSAFVDNTIQMPVVSASVNNPTCGKANGSTNISVSLGTAPYYFYWNNGDTTQNLSGLPAGTYNLTITDAASCTLAETINLNSINGPSLTDSVFNASCGNNNGSVLTYVSGGTPPYSFAWSNGSTAQNLSGTAAGNYSVTVKDKNSCVANLAITIPGTTAPSISETHVQPSCGKSDGSITISATGGLPPYTYLWSDSSSAASITNIPGGLYDVNVTDADNCMAALSVTLNSCTPTCNINVTDSLQNIFCVGACTGGIFLTVNNALPPVQYQWSDGTTGQNLQNLCAGVYRVTIQDANGCADTSAFFLPMAKAARLQVQSTSVMCNGLSQGSLNAIITDDYSPYTYQWSNGATTATVDNVPAGIYTVLIKDGEGCTYSGSDTINEPEPLLVFNSSTNEYCNQSNGSITLNVSGGMTPYSFKWNNNDTTQNLSGLSAGNYSVTVMDKNGCSGITSVFINDIPAQPVTLVPLSARICETFSTILTANGVSSYTWSPTAGLSSTTGATVSASPSSTTTYTVTGTDLYGCTSSASVPVMVYNAPVITINPAQPSFCVGGEATLNMNGAEAYQWTEKGTTYNTTGNSITVSPTQTTVYTIKGTDAYGCTASDSVNVIVNPLPIVQAIANDSIVCSGSPVLLNANSSSSDNIAYKWSAAGGTIGSTQQITVTPTANTTYSVTLKDANGCTASSAVQVNVTAGPQINITASDTALCFGQNMILTYSGADIYSWSPSTGIISSNNTSATVAPTVTTAYTLTGTDNLPGCSSSKQIVIKVHPLPDVKINNVNLNACLGSDIQLTASGALNYIWSANNAVATSTGSSISITAIQATRFTVTGTDAFGCVNSDTGTVKVYSRPLASFSTSEIKGCAPMAVLFYNNSVNAKSFNWLVNNKPASTDSEFEDIFDAGIYYVQLIAIGDGGCSDTTSMDSSIEVLPSPIANFNISPAFNTPVLLNNASFSFTNLSSGAFLYSWDFGDNTYSNVGSPTHKYTKGGSYTVTLVALNTLGCTDTVKKSSVIVTEEANVFIPNTFTPNADGKNDLFKIYGTGTRNIAFTIFDRDGAEIYHTDSNVPWDGTYKGEKLNSGVFICTAVIEYLTGKKEYRQGDITLLR